MRILQLITQDRGGPVDHALDVAVELAGRGHDSHLAGPPGPYADAAAAAGVVVHPVRVRSKTDLVGARAVAGLVRHLRPDVVHLQDRRAGLVGRVLSWPALVPTVYTLHGVPDPLAPLVPGNAVVAPAAARDRLDHLVLERALARVPASVVVTPCDALARYARDHVGIPAERVRTVHNGVGRAWLGRPGADVPRMNPADRGDDRADDRAVRAVWLGVMQPVKRVPALVRAAAAVPGLRLDLVGDGPQRPAVEAAIAVAGSADRVRLHGFLSDPSAVLADADLLVLPSAAEACPMAILQAMACGLPIVASRAGGIPEVVRDGIDGLLVPTADDAALTTALARLVADAPARRRMGASARRRLEERFTVGACVDRLFDVYGEVRR